MKSEFLDLSNIDLDNTFEPIVLKAGEEAELRIVSCLVSTDKNGNDFFMPFFDIVGDPYVKEFGEYLPYPNPETMSENQVNKAKVAIANFGQAFNVDFSSPINIEEDLVNLTGWAILGVGSDIDGEAVNKVNRFLVAK